MSEHGVAQVELGDHPESNIFYEKLDEGKRLHVWTWRGTHLIIEVLPDGTLWLETPGYFLRGTNQSISCVPGGG